MFNTSFLVRFWNFDNFLEILSSDQDRIFEQNFSNKNLDSLFYFDDVDILLCLVLEHGRLGADEDVLKHKTICYETITFGLVTHTLEAAAMRVRSFVYDIHIM